ncbi:MAG: choloylglycine hydrolase family protein [Verrucomicrobiota bacterium]
MQATHRTFVILTSLLAAFVVYSLIAPAATACTGITIKPKDGSVIRARSMEFGLAPADLIIIPRGAALSGDDGSKIGLKWKAKYGVIGANMVGLTIVTDGLNEKGLSGGTFMFNNGYAVYPKVAQEDEGKVLASGDVVTYVLSNCATVSEAVETIKTAAVRDCIFKDWGYAPQFHYLFTDAGGHCAVIEYTAGGMKVYDNPLGVITNSPPFDWQLINLNNYINLSVFNPAPIKFDGVTLTEPSAGGGMLGLPGDFGAPSRFIRAVTFSQTALPVQTADEGVLQAFHILNLFDIPKGAIREKMPDGKMMAEFTDWTSAADVTNLRFYIRTYTNSRIRMLDLTRCNIASGNPVIIKLDQKEIYEDLTPSVHNTH